MPGIFISYRRADSTHMVGRIFDYLTTRYDRTRIILDVDSIRQGQSFPEILSRAISESSVGPIVMVPDWLTAADTCGMRRIDQVDDFVRLEVERLLIRGIPVIPCLVEHGTMPSADALPASLRALSVLQAAPSHLAWR